MVKSILGYASSILLEKAIFPPIADLAPENPVLCSVTFLLVPLDLGLISWHELIVNILRKSAMQRNPA